MTKDFFIRLVYLCINLYFLIRSLSQIIHHWIQQNLLRKLMKKHYYYLYNRAVIKYYVAGLLFHNDTINEHG